MGGNEIHSVYYIIIIINKIIVIVVQDIVWCGKPRYII